MTNANTTAWRAAQTAALAGGSEASQKRHTERGKLPVRERISRLLDPGTPFQEIGQLAAADLYNGAVPSAALVTGIGMVSGHLTMIMANDATVKGGTYYPLTIKKQLRAQLIARENRLACIYMVDSGGAFLPMQDDIFPDEHHFGRIFRNIAELSADGVPQIAAVMGSCTAGGAYIPAMCDETVIVKATGTIFLGGPQLVQAATQEIVDPETLGGADLHTRSSAVADHFAADDSQALAILRDIMVRKPARAPIPPARPPQPPLGAASDIDALIPATSRQKMPVRDILMHLVDGGGFLEYRARYGTTLICGTAHIGGYEVGILLNDGVLFSESAQKGANFIELCCQRDIPLLFLHNINGFMVGAEYEAGGIARHGAKLVNAVSTARVPKFSLLIGGSYGAGNFAMCGRAFGPRLMAMWPNARTSVMGGEQAARVLSLVREGQTGTMTVDERTAFETPIRETYEVRSTPVYAASRLWIDAVIAPSQTREWLILGLAMAAGSPKEETRFGVFRM
ncbi:carboxyl transferase domain-containing protein [Sulfitobacter dubius]|uniref:Methylmalonyl-CoA carboxyltransferase 12S subunit n=1 Tax=Sulfitobacter dubius TaxID=218673 RepID=A0ABY3ZSJ0_9RHOB|nr:carboxyl transferase domain-containing protein [Sulfitobacter dubius]UOA17197.1 Methylmalonyl-CoA carboxyltransferase 12S subunit [Sulfitobacter dubius]